MSRLIVVVLLALSSLALPSAAQADMWTGVDDRGEVVTYDIEAPEICEATAPAPDKKSVDLTRVGLKHRAHSVLLRATVRDLRPRDLLSVGFFIETPDRAYGASLDRYGPRHTSTFFSRIPRKFASMTCGDAFGQSGGSSSASRPDPGCREPKAEIVGDTVRVRVLRHCLGRPDWVRIGVYVFGGPTEDDTLLALDTWVPPGDEPTGFVVGAISPKIPADR